jgi:anti-sigma regulatory factor (Ser/Thr protein kinase)
MTLRKHVQNQDCDHAAFFYYSEREYVDSLVEFIREGFDQRQPVMLAVPGDKLESLCGALGDAAASLTTADITDLGRNPGRILAEELAFVDRHPGQHVRIVAEPAWVGRTDSEYLACMQHEALVSLAFVGTEMTGLCPYDASQLDESVLANVRLTHSQIWVDGSLTQCPEYAVDTALEHCNQPLETHPAAVTHTVEQPAGLAGARRCAERYGRLLGLSPGRMADLLLIATELATNSLAHARGACRMAFWYEDGCVVCEARDMGHWADPLAGRRPPVSRGSGAYGLFVVNAIADLLRTHTTPAGTTVQAFLRIDDSSEVAS